MKKTSLFLASAATGMMALGLMASDNAQADENEKEKCYGVVKAGANDCGAKGHSCAGHATADAGADEWIFVPKGVCERLAGGSTEPKSGE